MEKTLRFNAGDSATLFVGDDEVPKKLTLRVTAQWPCRVTFKVDFIDYDFDSDKKGDMPYGDSHNATRYDQVNF